jgi:hypothetical protein
MITEINEGSKEQTNAYYHKDLPEHMVNRINGDLHTVTVPSDAHTLDACSPHRIPVMLVDRMKQLQEAGQTAAFQLVRCHEKGTQVWSECPPVSNELINNGFVYGWKAGVRGWELTTKGKEYLALLEVGYRPGYKWTSEHMFFRHDTFPEGVDERDLLLIEDWQSIHTLIRLAPKEDAEYKYCKVSISDRPNLDVGSITYDLERGLYK